MLYGLSFYELRGLSLELPFESTFRSHLVSVGHLHRNDVLAYVRAFNSVEETGERIAHTEAETKAGHASAGTA